MTANTNNLTAPYARPKPVLDLIRRYRNRDLPNPVTTRSLETVGLAESSAHQSIMALKHLKLVAEDGRINEAFDDLRRASTQEYPTVLAEIIRRPYEAVFRLVDPAQDSYSAIEDAFRGYTPTAQRERMVRLFIELCKEAGIVSLDSPAWKHITTPPTPTRVASNANGRKPVDSRRKEDAPPSPPPPKDSTPAPPAHTDPAQPDYHKLLDTLIGELPTSRKWSKADRDSWLAAMTGIIDLLVKVPTESNTA